MTETPWADPAESKTMARRGTPARNDSSSSNSKPVARPKRGHPLVRLAGTVARLPRYLNLAQGLARESSVAPMRKAALVGGFGYAVLPFDLIPGVIPLIGQLDDLAALLLGIRTALRGCAPEVARAHMERAGLAETALDADLRNVEVASVWLVSKVGSLGARAVSLPFRLWAAVRR